jgi:hypothetical protein
VQNKKKAFDVLHQWRSRAAQELRYSALEVEHHVFGLKCLVPAPLWIVINPGQWLVQIKNPQALAA